MFRKKYPYERLFGVRVHKLRIKDLETRPITSYLYFGDTNFPSNMMDIIKPVDVVEKPAIAKKNVKGKRNKYNLSLKQAQNLSSVITNSNKPWARNSEKCSPQKQSNYSHKTITQPSPDAEKTS